MAVKKARSVPNGMSGANEISRGDPNYRSHTRGSLLRAAISSFNRQGFHQTSLEEIGESLGLSKAALYYYFPSKSALLAACFDRAMSLSWDCLARARREGRSGRERLILYLSFYIEAANAELYEYFLLTEDFALDREYREQLIVQRDKMELELRGLVRAGIADGSIVACDPKLAVFLLLGAVNWIPKWFSPDGAWSARQLAKATAEMLDRMLSTTPAAGLTADVLTIAAEPRRPEARGRKPVAASKAAVTNAKGSRGGTKS